MSMIDRALRPDVGTAGTASARLTIDVAVAAGTIGCEVLTNLGHRFHRVYLGA